MKLARVRTRAGQVRLGVLEDDGSLTVIEGELLGEWRPGTERIAADQIERFLAPIEPPNIIAIGLNYRAHAIESGKAIPTAPVIFIKPTSAIVGQGDAIELPAAAPDEVDWEAELALIIKKRARKVSEAEALDYVLGWTAANDVSARDCQTRLDLQWARGKGFDTFAPLGPVIQTEGNPDALRIQCRIDGRTMQDSTTADMIFPCATLISYLSHQFTLLPGTVILTGTPQGVGFGLDPKRYLRAGEVVEVELEGVGVLRNPVVKG